MSIYFMEWSVFCDSHDIRGLSLIPPLPTNVSDPAESLSSFLRPPQKFSNFFHSCHLLCAFPVLLSLFWNGALVGFVQYHSGTFRFSPLFLSEVENSKYCIVLYSSLLQIKQLKPTVNSLSKWNSVRDDWTLMILEYF